MSAGTVGPDSPIAWEKTAPQPRCEYVVELFECAPVERALVRVEMGECAA